MKVRILALGILVAGLAVGYFVYPFSGIIKSLDIPLKLGLDLKGGIHLVYDTDLSKIPSEERSAAMEGLRDAVERRVSLSNLFGVAEPVIHTQRSGESRRIVVELAGVFDTNEAVKLIGQTPFLEFRTLKAVDKENKAADENKNISTSTPVASGEDTGDKQKVVFEPTELTGMFLKHATVEFDSTTNKPYIGLEFNDEGARIFERLTEENIGKPLAIFLDGTPMSTPIVRDKISGGRAQITGDFTLKEVQLLVRRLNSGALPVPMTLVSQQSVEPSLGTEALRKSFSAGLFGLLFVAICMILWYRLPGVIAVLSLGIYVVVVLALFKLISVTMTAAGIAGFVLSVGMAVDANILIFERTKEELKQGRKLVTAIEEGFLRAWTSIRDSNVSSIITSLILWVFGTSIVKGFAITLGIGIIISMLSAVVITRTFMRASCPKLAKGKAARFLFGTGLR